MRSLSFRTSSLVVQPQTPINPIGVNSSQSSRRLRSQTSEQPPPLCPVVQMY